MRSIRKLVFLLAEVVVVVCGQVWPTVKSETRSGEKVQTFSGFQIARSTTTTTVLNSKGTVLYEAISRLQKHRFMVKRSTPKMQVHLDIVGPIPQAETLDRNTAYEYNLTITHLDIRIQAISSFGIVYGLDTLMQLLDRDEMTLPITKIIDGPAKKHRGVLVDVARHFLPLPLLKRTAASLGAAKMNVMHLHLTDSQSFPVLLSSVPELATKGSFDYPEQTYTPSDLRALVAHAKLFGVRIIPEIDIPAHTLSWGQAYPELIVHCSSSNAESESDVPTLDPSQALTYEIIFKVLTEITSIFPDELIHLGSDEIHFKCWLENQNVCRWALDTLLHASDHRRLSELIQHRVLRQLDTQQRILRQSTCSTETAHLMLGYFLQKVTTFVTNQLGKTVVLWQEALEVSLDTLPKNTIIQTWRCWGGQDETAARIARHAGLTVIDASCWYLDWPSSYENYYRKKLLGQWSEFEGGEAALWTERVDASNFECKLWPRAAFVAQILWHGDIITSPNVSEAKRIVHSFSKHLTTTTGMRPANFDDDSGASAVEHKAVCSSIDQKMSPRKPPRPPSRLAFAVCDEAEALLALKPMLPQFHNDIYLVAAFFRSISQQRLLGLITDAARSGFAFSLKQSKDTAIISTAPIITLSNNSYTTGGLFIRYGAQPFEKNLFNSVHNFPLLHIHAKEDIVPQGTATQWPNTTITHIQNCHLFVWHPDPNGAGEPENTRPLSFFQVDSIPPYARLQL